MLRILTVLSICLHIFSLLISEDHTEDIVGSCNVTIDAPMDVSACGSYLLPPITGTNVANAHYFTGLNGGGMLINPGTIITNSITLYLFDPDPFCTSNQPIFSITMEDGPIVQNDPFIVSCLQYSLSPPAGIGLTGNEEYYDQPDGNGTPIPSGSLITQDSVIYLFDDTPGCNYNIPITIDIRIPTNTGMDSTFSVCVGTDSLYNFMQLLGEPSPDMNGKWIERSGTNVLFDSSAVNLSSLGVGNFEFEYRVCDDICGDRFSTLTISILPKIPKGVDNTLIVCEDISEIDLFNILQITDASGTFYDEFGIPANFDYSNASFTLSNPGSTLYHYIVGDMDDICGPDTTNLTIITNQDINAGQDVILSLCIPDSILLSSLLIDNNTVGQLYDANFSQLESNFTIYSADLASDQYTFFHIVEGLPQCPKDTAEITIDVIPVPDAGPDVIANICFETSVDLSNFTQGDQNGNFIYNNTPLTSPVFDLNGQEGSFTFIYEVQNEAFCPKDSASIILSRNNPPIISVEIDTETLCMNECTSIHINSNTSFVSSDIIYMSITDGLNIAQYEFMPQTASDSLTIQYCVSNTGSLQDFILAPGLTYSFTLDSIRIESLGCTYEVNSFNTISTLDNGRSSILGPICKEDSVLVGSAVVYPNTPAQDIILPNMASNGCDSIVSVDIDAYPMPMGLVDLTLCEGDSIDILGITYKQSISQDTVLKNASIHGCDSMVIIDLIFIPPSTSIINQSICQGDSLMIGDEYFDTALVEETILLAAASSSGCDSLITVDLEILPLSDSIISDIVCPSYTLIVNGNEYNSEMPAGTEVIEGASANGCDSIYQIDLRYELSEVDSFINITTCDPDFAIDIGLSSFNIDNANGVSRIASTTESCDTNFIVDIDYDLIFAEYNKQDAGCTHPDSGFIVIENISGTAPFTISYENSIDEPYCVGQPIMLAPDENSLLVTDANNCTTTIDYTISENDIMPTITQIGDQMILDWVDVQSISWSPATGLSCTDCIDPVVTIKNSTTYTAVVQFDDDCEIAIEYRFKIFTPPYIVPSIFSPNDDGINDKLTLFLTEDATGTPVEMSIYDRWGNRMYYEVNSEEILSVGWNGMTYNKPASSGVYVYELNIFEDGKIITLTGDVTLIR